MPRARVPVSGVFHDTWTESRTLTQHPPSLTHRVFSAATPAAKMTATAMKGRVNVFSRVRPGVAREVGDQHCVEMNTDMHKCVVRLQDGDAVERVLAGGSAAPGRAIEKEFTFDGVFDPESTQKEVYEEVGKPVLKDVLQGYNGSILAYGQTGAGKTHSLLNSGMGIDGKPDPKQAGLLPRLVAALFVHIGADATSVYTVEASMLQIYNEQIDCLLGEDREKAQGLQVTGKSEVRGLAWARCKTPNELLQCFQRGRNNLVYAETKMNKSSSRSHAVFQIKVAKRPRATDGGKAGKGKIEMRATFGKLTVVDLAGSERIKKSGVVGAQLKEATNINSSLLAFGNIVQALAEKKKFIPYRDSKLTRILEDSVGGNCKTSLLVCCSPSADSSDETVSTLEFASRAARIEITATINEGTMTVDAASLVADLAGDGLDSALKEKQKEMLALENRLKTASDKRDAELVKAKNEAVKQQQAEAAKATEAGKLMNTWRLKAEEAGRKISELEMAVKDAKEAKEAKEAMAEMEKKAKAAVAEKEKEVQHLKATLAKERAERAREADAQAEDLRAQVAATRALLDEANAKSEALETRATEADALVAELGRQLEASAEALEATSEEAAAAAAKAAEEKASALLEKEFEALTRCEEAAAKAKAEAEAEAEAERDRLKQEWTKRLSDQVTDAADQLARATETFETERAERDASIARMEAEAEERSARVAALEKEAADLNEATRSDLLAQREIAAAEAARLDAAHAAALSAVNARRREEAAAAEARLAEAEKMHSENVQALNARADLRGKRLSWAFSASRALLDDANAALKADHDDMKARFDARESREDDVAQIRGLRREVGALEAMCGKLRSETKQLSLELDNRNQNDLVFGSSGGRPVSGATARNHLGQTVSGTGRRPETRERPHTEQTSRRSKGAGMLVGPRSSGGHATYHHRDTLRHALKPPRKGEIESGLGGTVAPPPAHFGGKMFQTSRLYSR